ncbi:lysozyme [Novosphingobium huizhouense]|uniref:lysozyme n=1 Tax=Novosphingobium huizhouense TaxID=2866625 RepID=UPI001CD8CA79|nr:lysozyme [Novosphingobium huizhouense]
MAAIETDRPRLRKGTLAALVGLTSAGLLLTSIPGEESGRKVDVTIAVDGTATVRHVSGQQYLQAYRDIAGIPTACDGLTKGIRMGQRYSEAQCAAMLEAELVRHADGVMRCTPGLALTIPGRDRARAAAISLAYNIGVGAWCGSTAARRINAGQIREGCDAMLAWDKARVDGALRAVRGLTFRRQRERALCLQDA